MIRPMHRFVRVAVALLVMCVPCSLAIASNPSDRGEQFIANDEDPDAIAGVWTVNSDLVVIKITRINGKRLRPARLNLNLAPGTYTLDAELELERGQNPFWHPRAFVNDFSVTVKAGHTYGLNHQYSEDRKRSGLVLEDMGTRQRCEYIDLPTSRSVFLDCTTRQD